MTNPQADGRFAVRGILILLVMLGHNRIFRDNFYYSGYLFVYAFHVGSFFLIATMSPPRAVSRTVLIGLARRILLPFFATLIVYWAIYTAQNLHQTGGSLMTWAGKLAAALLLENTWALREAAGLKMLWFLPAFFLFCLIYNLYGQTRGWTRNLFIGLAMAVHVSIGSLSNSAVDYVPFSANVVAFLVVPALLFSAVEPRVRGSILSAAASIVVFAAASILALRSHTIFVLSDSMIPDWHRPLALLLGDCQLIFGCITVLIVAQWLQGVRVLTELGKRSLQLYLLHPLVNVAATMLFARYLPWPAAMVFVTASTIIVAFLLSRATERLALGAYIFGLPARTSTSRVSEAV